MDDQERLKRMKRKFEIYVFLVSLLVLFLAPFASARQMALPSIPILASGETDCYDDEENRATTGQAEQLQSVSPGAADVQGGIKQATEGVKENPYRINYKTNSKKGDNRISNVRMAEPDQLRGPVLEQTNQPTDQEGENLDLSLQKASSDWRFPDSPQLTPLLFRPYFGFDEQLNRNTSR